MIKTDEMPMWS